MKKHNRSKIYRNCGYGLARVDCFRTTKLQKDWWNQNLLTAQCTIRNIALPTWNKDEEIKCQNHLRKFTHLTVHKHHLLCLINLTRSLSRWNDLPVHSAPRTRGNISLDRETLKFDSSSPILPSTPRTTHKTRHAMTHALLCRLTIIYHDYKLDVALAKCQRATIQNKH